AWFDVDSDRWLAVRQFAAKTEATPAAVFLAAFTSVLSRHARASDLVIAVPTAGRSRREIEDTIGFFVNTVVVRTQLSDGPSFTELTRRVQTSLLAAQMRERVPFERVVDRLAPQRDLSRSPIFQVMFAYQSVEPPVLRL